MNSLFDPAENERILGRIRKLTPASNAQWGKMNVTQMLTHCQQPLRVVYGELKLKRNLMGVLFGKMIKRMLLKDEPYKPGLPTAKEFIITDTREFEKEKNALMTLVQRFSKQGPEGISKDPHPLFGKMTPSEWDFMQWKHLDHHLRQFGT
jgi:hypothetical protein